MKTKLNRLLLLVLALALALALVPGAALADDFSDVSADAWYAGAVDYAVDNGLMQGIGNGLFGPDVATTRAMIVTILYRLDGEPTVEGEPSFSDVPARQWYTYAVMWSNNNGIVKGYTDGTFKPAADITREQFVSILYRYAQYKGYDVSVGEDTNILSYEDALEVSDWANAAVRWAVGAGLLQGDDKGCLAPAAGATRAQAAALFQRFLENVQPANSLVGVWYSEDFDGAFVYTFNVDGTGNYKVTTTDMPFTYTAEDGKLSILYEDVDVPWETEYTVADGKLTVKDDLGEDVVYTKDKPVNPIAGTWYSQTFDGAFVFTFNEDYTGNYDAAGTDMPFTYATNDGSLSILYEDVDVPFETEYTVEGDTFTMKDSLGEDVVYTRTKPENPIVGTWASEEFDGTFIYTFNADLTGSYDAAGTVMPFTYVTNAGALNILYEGDDAPWETQYTIADDTLTVKDDLGEDVIYHKE